MTIISPSLLITDDDRDFRDTLRGFFEPRGFVTYTAADGAEAVSIVRRKDVHLVLLDLHMPRLTGLEAARLVKRYRAELPCILISAGWDAEVLAEAERVPVFSTLAKPVSFDEVKKTVALALREVYNWSLPNLN